MADNVELADRVLHELYDNYGGPETVGIPYGQAVREALAAAGLVIVPKEPLTNLHPPPWPHRRAMVSFDLDE